MINSNTQILDINNIDVFSNKDLRNYTLSNDIDIFQKIKNKSLLNCKLPKGDYSNHNFEGVDIRGCIFTEDSILPKNIDIFQKIKHKSLWGTSLPEGDYSKHIFNNVDLRYCIFTYNSKLPKSKRFLVKLKNKSIEGCILPKHDFTKTYFNGVNIRYTKFTVDSLFSKDKRVFLKIANRDLSYTQLPKHNFSKYRFKKVIMVGCKFTPNSKLPSRKNFFKDIKNLDVSFTQLPTIDLNKYNIDSVDFKGAIFTEESTLIYKSKNINKSLFETKAAPAIDLSLLSFDKNEFLMENINFNKDSKLPLDPFFFQNAFKGVIRNCTLPPINYKRYLLHDVLFINCTFHEDSTFPENESLFSKIYSIKNAILPKQILDNIHIYNIDKHTLFSIMKKNRISVESIFIYNNLKNSN